MNRFRVLTLRLAPAALLLALALKPTPAKADVTIFDSDGWSFYTRGLIAAHYSFAKGDGDPRGFDNRVLAGGQFLTSNVEDGRGDAPTVTLSRIRSGFVGTQIGFGINRQISERVHVESLLAINMNDISNDRGQDGVKGVDFREAWASVVTPYGSFKFGRMFSIFGSASAQVVLMAYRYAQGNPCTFAVPGSIGCGSVGAGPLYAGFDAQMRYISPRVAGFEFQFSVSDPTRSSTEFLLTPLPRIDAEVNFDRTIGPAHLRVYGQGLYEAPEKVDGDALKKLNVWGLMASGIVDVGGLSLGGGAWTGAGIGIRVPLEVEDPTYPLSFDPKTGEARLFRGFFGNATYELPTGTSATVGGGTVFIRPTDTDKAANPMNLDPPPTVGYTILTQNAEFHLVLAQKIDTVVLTGEFMHWTSAWYFGEKQAMNFLGAGANYFW
jgi:hypothetical protein